MIDSDVGRAVLALALVASSLAGSMTAAAQTPSERALAESLFREGKQLLARGDYASACRKLEESQRLDPVGGTLLNLATCHEKEGKLATAWAEYQSALELAKRANRRDRVTLAQRKVDELAPRVPYLTITLDGEAPPGLRVELDGVVMGSASLGTRLAVDPGNHELVATAEDRVPWKTSVTLAEGDKKTAVIAELALAQKPAAPPPPPPAETPPGTWMKPTSYVLGGVAALGLVIGSGFGIAALSDGSTVEERCPSNVCDAEGLAAHEDGRSAATVANVGLVLGVLAGAGAVTLFLLAPDEAEADAPSVALTPVVGPGAAGSWVRVRF